jgi:Variant SH3 domain
LQYTAEVLYDSTPSEENELKLQFGDVITNIIINKTEWWEGEIDGKRGYFPRSYVRLKPVQISPATKIVVSLKVNHKQICCDFSFFYGPKLILSLKGSCKMGER